jgi:hypothetical protein
VLRLDEGREAAYVFPACVIENSWARKELQRRQALNAQILAQSLCLREGEVEREREERATAREREREREERARASERARAREREASENVRLQPFNAELVFFFAGPLRLTHTWKKTLVYERERESVCVC